MSRVRTPYYEIREMRDDVDEYVWPKTIVRAYKRVDGKFVPVGWHVTWSDNHEKVYLDNELLA